MPKYGISSHPPERLRKNVFAHVWPLTDSCPNSTQEAVVPEVLIAQSQSTLQLLTTASGLVSDISHIG